MDRSSGPHLQKIGATVKRSFKSFAIVLGSCTLFSLVLAFFYGRSLAGLIDLGSFVRRIMRLNIATLALVLAFGGCSDERQSAKLPATEEVLSQYQTIRIGSEKLTLPTIALLSSTTTSNIILSDSTLVPMGEVLSQSLNGARVVRIDLSIHAYRRLQDYHLHTHAYVSSGFCERLLARWEKDQCSIGLYNGKNEFSPQHFQVIDLAYLIGSNDQLFAIGGRGPMGGEAARALLAKAPGEQISCAQEQQPLCTAIFPIRRDLVAVWATRREEFEADKRRINWLVDQYFARQ